MHNDAMPLNQYNYILLTLEIDVTKYKLTRTMIN